MCLHVSTKCCKTKKKVYLENEEKEKTQWLGSTEKIILKEDVGKEIKKGGKIHCSFSRFTYYISKILLSVSISFSLSFGDYEDINKEYFCTITKANYDNKLFFIVRNITNVLKHEE